MNELAKDYQVEPFVKVKRGQIITNSLDVADNFGKRHEYIIKKVRDILKNWDTSQPMKDFGALNFKESSYTDESNRKQVMFDMTRDGFSFLAMGLTGSKAAIWKVKYINAFNMMEKQILNQNNQQWVDDRRQGKISRKEVTEAIKQFVQYAEKQGSKHAGFYYATITKATYTALFLIERKAPTAFRNMLDSIQLTYLSIAEHKGSEALLEGMALGMNYKNIYKLYKGRIEECALFLGKTKALPNNGPQMTLLK